jgi:hypothetical protein
MTIRTPGSLAKLGSPGHLTHITGPKPNFSPAVEFFRRGLVLTGRRCPEGRMRGLSRQAEIFEKYCILYE